MSAKFIGQGKWVREILKKFTDLEKFHPEPFNRDLQWPEWVDNLFLILMGISYPGTKFKNVKKWKAKDLGRFLGRQYAGEHLLQGQVPLSPQVQREAKKSFDWLETRAKQKFPEFNLEKVTKKCEPQQRVWEIKFGGFLQESLASACERPYVEASAFFEAFGKATIIKPNELESERTLGVGDKICWLMILLWQELEQLHSVAELHRVFEKALKPHGIQVRYKRIEKLCQRIKLKFRDAGRPTGSKIPTNSTSV